MKKQMKAKDILFPRTFSSLVVSGITENSNIRLLG